VAAGDIFTQPKQGRQVMPMSDMSMVLTDLINVNRAHFVETNDFKEPKFSVAIVKE
jgi:hypothetical protein